MKRTTASLALLSIVLVNVNAQAQTQTANPTTMAQRTAGLQRQEGFLPIYLDSSKGRLLMEVRLNEEMLYFVTVSKGIGSVDLGIDRGASSGSKLIHVERSGPRALIVESNLHFRAPAGNSALRQGMEESFAGSTLTASATT